MPHYKCTCCHHEFDLVLYEHEKELTILCDWCGAPSYILEDEIPLERMVRNIEELGGFEKWCETWGLNHE